MQFPDTAPTRGTPAGTDPAVLRMARAAGYIGVSRSFLYLLVERGELPKIKLGGRAAGIRRADLDRWLDTQSGG
jgi:excisionase family DNA binding protein